MKAEVKKIVESIFLLLIVGALFPLLKTALEDIFNLSGLAAGIAAGLVTFVGLVIVVKVIMNIWE